MSKRETSCVSEGNFVNKSKKGGWGLRIMKRGTKTKEGLLFAPPNVDLRTRSPEITKTLKEKNGLLI